MINKQNRIDAAPTKEFFIDYITRDINLQDCVLDLIDNSLHSVILEYDLDVMKVLEGRVPIQRSYKESINISLSRERFEIKDTCNGISIEEARDEVFRFGISKIKKKHPGLSVFGIGMKRAIFKIGKDILIKSKTKSEEFEVHIPVDEWRKDKDKWEFELKQKTPSNSTTSHETGTTITITDLNEGVGERFQLDSFIKELIRKVSSTYALFLKTGINIEINKQKVKQTLPEIGSYKYVTGGRKKIKCNGVETLIVTGITPVADKTPRGWYVFCNGRMVIEADKTKLTGWGENFPSYHSKYNHFVGYVYFRSEDIGKLPWTTTKHSVSFESPVYQCALKEMLILGRPVTNFLNKMYPGDIDPEGITEREMLEKVKSITLDKLPKRDSSFSVDTSKLPQIKNITIAYKKSLKDIDKVRASLKNPNMPYKKVGEYTFDYYLKKECD